MVLFREQVKSSVEADAQLGGESVRGVFAQLLSTSRPIFG